MKKTIIIGICVVAIAFYLNWKPSAIEIARDIEVNDRDNQIRHNGLTYTSKWSDESISVSAFVRRIDRHYDKNMPIITYDFVLTSGDYNNPDIVKTDA